MKTVVSQLEIRIHIGTPRYKNNYFILWATGIDCRFQSPGIVAVNSQRCVHIWLVTHNRSNSYFSQTFLNSSYLLFVREIFCVNANDMCVLLAVTWADFGSMAKASADHSCRNRLPYFINLSAIILEKDRLEIWIIFRGNLHSVKNRIKFKVLCLRTLFFWKRLSLDRRQGRGRELMIPPKTRLVR